MNVQFLFLKVKLTRGVDELLLRTFFTVICSVNVHLCVIFNPKIIEDNFFQISTKYFGVGYGFLVIQ